LRFEELENTVIEGENVAESAKELPPAIVGCIPPT
jgi:hypothetical protein